MLVLINSTGAAGEPAVAVREPEDLTRLHVEVDGVEEEAADRALAASGLGRLADRETAQLSVDGLRAASPDPAEPGWSERYAGMLAYAARKGWLSEDGRWLQAHTVWR